MSNAFAKLAALNCGEHLEKKGGFTYLSWPWAVKKLRETAPDATWEVKRFEGVPYMKTECGFFVEVAVTVDGVTLSQIHPVLDQRNKPIAQPDSFHINTSIQRCLVKAIALHGLGLYIYAGEDLPEANGKDWSAPVNGDGKGINPNAGAWEAMDYDSQKFLTDVAHNVGALLAEDNVAGAFSYLAEQKLSVDEKAALNTRFDSKQRTKMRNYMNAHPEAKAAA